MPPLEEKDKKWFASLGLRVKSKPQPYQANTHFRTAAVRSLALARVLGWALDRGYQNIWDHYGSDRTKKLAARIEEACGKPLDEMFEVCVTGQEIVPADMLRRQGAIVEERPIFKVNRPTVMLLTNVYAWGASKLTPAVLRRVMADHELEGVIWLGHQLKEAWGTVCNEAAYYIEPGPQGNTVHFRPDHVTAPYPAHDVMEWIHNDGARDGVAWTTLFNIGGGPHDTGMTAKWIARSDIVQVAAPARTSRRHWTESTLLDVESWSLKGWWTWLLHKTCPTLLRRYLPLVPGVLVHQVVVDENAMRAIRARLTGRAVNPLLVRNAATAYTEALRGDAAGQVFEQCFPGVLDAQATAATVAICAGVLDHEQPFLEALWEQYGDLMVERNALVAKMGTTSPNSTPMTWFASAAVIAIGVVACVTWKVARRFAQPASSLMRWAAATAGHSWYNSAVLPSEHPAMIIGGAAVEEMIRYQVMQRTRAHPILVAVIFSAADLAVDWYLGSPIVWYGQLARLACHTCCGYMQQDFDRRPPTSGSQWSAFKRRVMEEGGSAMHDDAIVSEVLTLDGEENTIPTTQQATRRDMQNLNIVEDSSDDLESIEEEDGLKIVRCEMPNLNYAAHCPSLGAPLARSLQEALELLPDQAPRVRVHWFQPLGVALQQPGKTDKNKLATFLYRTAKLPPLGRAHRSKQERAWKTKGVRAVIQELKESIESHGFAVIERTRETVDEWISQYPSMQRNRLRLAAEQLRYEPIKPNEVPATKVDLKTDELLLKSSDWRATGAEPTAAEDAFLPRPINNVGPKVQFSTGFEINEASNRAKSVFTACPWSRAPDLFAHYHDLEIPVWLVFGSITDALLSALFTWAHNDDDHVIIVVAGDDQLLHCRVGNFEIMLEADVSMCDQSLMTGPLEAEYELEQALGVPEETTDVLRAQAHSDLRIQGETFDLTVSRANNPTRDTGGSNTSLGNTLVVGGACCVAVKTVPLESMCASAFERVTLGLGLKMKVTERSGAGSLIGATFLKMAIYPARMSRESQAGLAIEVLVMAPLEGRLLKMGKSYRDPRSYFEGKPTYREAAEAMMHVVAKCYDAYPKTPTYKARIERWLRYKPLKVRPTVRDEDWKPRMEAGREMHLAWMGDVLIDLSHMEVDEQAWHDVCLRRYGAAHSDVGRVLAWFQQEEQGVFLQHPLFAAWGLVDYG